MKAKSIVIPVLALLLIGAGAIFWAQWADRNYQYQGSSFAPFPEAYNFTLKDSQGQEFQLADQRGKVVLLFFGYANCPDVCPATLAEFKQIYQELGKQADQVEFVFVTVDPERDTPEQIDKYVHGFNASFVGLSGTQEELQPVWDGYFVARSKGETLPGGGYEMLHSTRVYVVDKQGRLRLTFPYGMEVDAMTEDVQHLLKEKG